MANPFAVQPLGGLQSIQGIKQGMAGIAEGVQQNRAEEQRRATMQKAAEIFERGDPREIAQFSIQNPEMAETLQSTFGFTNEQTKPIVMNTYQQALANPERAAEIMEQGIEQVTAAGGRPTNMTRDLQLLQQNPEAGLKSIEMGFAATAPDTYDRFFGKDDASDVIPPSNVREWEYYNSLPKEQQRQYLTMKRASQGFKRGDVQMTQDPTDPTQAEVVTEPGADRTTQAEEQAKLTEQEAQKQATIKSRQQAVTKSGEAYDKLAIVEGMIPKYERAIELVKGGANTGVIADKFPDMTSEAVELRNVQNQLGLDVISSVTFGALSAPELRMALQTALPTGLEGPELIDWLERKKEANRKLANYLSDAAQFLGRPDTDISDWMAKGRSEGNSGERQEGQTVNWSDL